MNVLGTADQLRLDRVAARKPATVAPAQTEMTDSATTSAAVVQISNEVRQAHAGYNGYHQGIRDGIRKTTVGYDAIPARIKKIPDPITVSDSVNSKKPVLPTLMPIDPPGVPSSGPTVSPIILTLPTT